MSPRTFVIAAGGTAGHVVPALAVGDALRADGHRVVVLGGDREEARLVPEAGFELRQVSVEGLSRTNPLKAARGVARAAGAVRAARRILRELEPAAVMGGGGYVAGVAGAAAASLRIPLVLTEADSHLGVSNRLLHRSARRVCLGFPLEGRGAPTFLVTGRPVPPPCTDRAAARASFGLDDATPCVLVFGGSLGARTVNEAAIAGLAGLQAPPLEPGDHLPPPRAGDGDGATVAAAPVGGPSGDVGRSAVRAGGSGLAAGAVDPAAAAAAAAGPVAVAVLHASGRRDHAALVERVPPGGDYRLFDYLSPLSTALAACDLVVARSGGSIAEVTAHGRPAILVPYPHAAADHQAANARWMAGAGAAVVVADDALDADRLRGVVSEILDDPPRRRAMAAASSALARPDAARAIADEVLAAGGAGPVHDV